MADTELELPARHTLLRMYVGIRHMADLPARLLKKRVNNCVWLWLLATWVAVFDPRVVPRAAPSRCADNALLTV